MNERETDSAAAGALRTPEVALDLIEIGVRELRIGAEAIARLVARMPAGPAGDLEPALGVEIGEFDICLPVHHQKSSAEGMRVYEILPPA